MKLLNEISKKQKGKIPIAKIDIPERDIKDLIPEKYLRQDETFLPELSEVEVVRHFVNLSSLNYHLDKGIYPLGSCTMKYNPKISEDMARMPSFSAIHPFSPEETVQGALKLMYELSDILADISGLKGITLQPTAGAHSELTGMLLVRAYHNFKGNNKKKVIIPDSAHGTNPASCTLAGFEPVGLKSGPNGILEIEDVEKAVDDDVGCLMVTNPNTLGLFETHIKEIAEILHKKDALLYMDGANLNAIMGIVKPGETGVDILHFNLHKTFSTPHGGGGPGGGGIGVSEKLVDFLPVPVIRWDGERYLFDYNLPHSIGKISTFFGNFGVMVKAYVYLRMLGEQGIKRVSKQAVISANYLKERLKEYYLLPYDKPCMHEFVLSGDRQKKNGVKTLDIAKALLDKGFHAPTVYFPLIVHEALMIEPTETEPLSSLDTFADALIEIAKKSKDAPEEINSAPINTPVGRLDEAKAARELNVRW